MPVDDASFYRQTALVNQMGTDANKQAADLYTAKQQKRQEALAAALQKQKDAAAAKVAKSQQDYLNKLQQQLQQTNSSYSNLGPMPPSSGSSSSGVTFKPGAGNGKNTFDNFRNAIVSQESGGNYRALGVPVSGDRAYGRYQIMGNNIPSWTRMATGRSYSPSQFLNNSALQDQVANYFLGNYYNKYGPAGAAVAWYAGEGTARKYVKRNGVGFNGGQSASGIAMPSVNSYALSILKKMGLR